MHNVHNYVDFLALICSHIRYIFNRSFRFTNWDRQPTTHIKRGPSLTNRLSSSDCSISNIGFSLSSLGGAVIRPSISVFLKKYTLVPSPRIYNPGKFGSNRRSFLIRSWARSWRA